MKILCKYVLVTRPVDLHYFLLLYYAAQCSNILKKFNFRDAALFASEGKINFIRFFSNDPAPKGAAK